MALFFISCPLRFENELAKELKSFWFEMTDLDGLPTRAAFPELELLQGGIQLETSDHLGFQINFFSKLANRVLLRIAKFEVRYYDQFEKALDKVDFNKYLTTKDLKLKVESHKSRLNNDKNIIEAATHALAKKEYKIKEDSTQTIFIRIEKDRVTVSLDTSGEHLHRRGYAVYRGEAPLRENLAAYVVRKLALYVPLDENLTLIDPFVGSGTLLFEANSHRLANLARTYSWLSFKNAPKLFQSPTWKKNYRWLNTQKLPQCLGFDINEKSINNLEMNKIEFNKIFVQNSIVAEVKDSRDLRLDRSLLKKSVWLVTNPPYGVRLADENTKQILEKIESHIEGLDGLIVIHPMAWKFNFKILSLVASEDFSNQGLNLKLSVFKRS